MHGKRSAAGGTDAVERGDSMARTSAGGGVLGVHDRDPGVGLAGGLVGPGERESNWKRSVGWSAATAAVGLQGVRVHDLRHTAASVWLGARADPKVVQRVLGHATASMTMDLYGHLVDHNLWEAAREAARAIGGILGASEPPGQQDEDADDAGADENAW
jgi:hypothetical protein